MASACGPDIPARTAPDAVGAPRFAITIDNDPVMGKLSGIAQHIAAAVQSPEVRSSIRDELRRASNGIAQLDLQDCTRNAVVRAMLDEGQRRGGGSSAALCSAIQQADGLTLYMDRDLLAAWDPAVVPVVTALSTPGTPLPATFRGFRTADATVDLPGDGSVTGPVLVVLPNAHPRHKSPRPELKPDVQVR